MNRFSCNLLLRTLSLEAVLEFLDLVAMPEGNLIRILRREDWVRRRYP